MATQGPIHPDALTRKGQAKASPDAVTGTLLHRQDQASREG